ncbi:hypothetical protein HDU67_009489, partial [Dinochytrium kinnereticum]
MEARKGSMRSLGGMIHSQQQASRGESQTSLHSISSSEAMEAFTPGPPDLSEPYNHLIEWSKPQDEEDEDEDDDKEETTREDASTEQAISLSNTVIRVISRSPRLLRLFLEIGSSDSPPSVTREGVEGQVNGDAGWSHHESQDGRQQPPVGRKIPQRFR